MVAKVHAEQFKANSSTKWNSLFTALLFLPSLFSSSAEQHISLPHCHHLSTDDRGNHKLLLVNSKDALLYIIWGQTSYNMGFSMVPHSDHEGNVWSCCGLGVQPLHCAACLSCSSMYLTTAWCLTKWKGKRLKKKKKGTLHLYPQDSNYCCFLVYAWPWNLLQKSRLHNEWLLH